MTAVAIITRPDGAIVVTDGGGYLRDGTLAVTAGKVIMLPEASTVITGRGSWLAQSAVNDEVTMSTRRLHLDDIVGFTPPLVDRILQRIVAADGGLAEQRFSLYIAGWSEGRQAGEAWGVRSYDHDRAAAGVPFRLPECYLAPELTQEVGDIIGLRMPSTGETQWRAAPRNYAVTALCAARCIPGRAPHELDLDGIEDRILCGAFVQVTTVCRHGVVSEIVHEWPDVVGEKIDPERGEPIPAWLFQREHTYDERPQRDPSPVGRPGKRARRRHR